MAEQGWLEGRTWFERALRWMHGDYLKHSAGDATADLGKASEEEGKRAWFKARYNLEGLDPSKGSFKENRVYLVKADGTMRKEPVPAHLSGRIRKGSGPHTKTYEWAEKDLQMYDIASREAEIERPHEPMEPWKARVPGASASGSATLDINPQARLQFIRDSYGAETRWSWVLRRLGLME